MKLSEWAVNLQTLVDEGYGDHEVEFEVTDLGILANTVIDEIIS